jgi:hypothetical protein
MTHSRIYFDHFHSEYDEEIKNDLSEFKSNERLVLNTTTRQITQPSEDISKGASKNLLFHDSENKNLYKKQDEMLMSVW